MGCFALFSVHFGVAFSFLLVTFQIATEGVRDFLCTDSGSIGLWVTRNDSLLHSMVEIKTKQDTGTQGTIFWEQGFKMQLIIYLLFLLTLVVKLVKNSHLKMQRMAHQNFW